MSWICMCHSLNLGDVTYFYGYKYKLNYILQLQTPISSNPVRAITPDLGLNFLMAVKMADSPLRVEHTE